MYNSEIRPEVSGPLKSDGENLLNRQYSAADCLINRSDFVQGLLTKLGTDRLTEFQLGEYYPRAKRNMWHIFDVIRSNRPEVEI